MTEYEPLQVSCLLHKTFPSTVFDFESFEKVSCVSVRQMQPETFALSQFSNFASKHKTKSFIWVTGAGVVSHAVTKKKNQVFVTVKSSRDNFVKLLDVYTFMMLVILKY